MVKIEMATGTVIEIPISAIAKTSLEVEF